MADDQPEPIAKSGNPLVFISHDTRDAELAEAFSNLLKSVSAGVLKSFRTSDRRGNQGIEYGVEWYPEIIKNIQGASDVVCLLTKLSVDRPWILFEAGMAKGKLDTPILGVALGIELKEASSGPFAQFQNCGDDEDSLTKLVFQLVNRIPNSEPDKDTIKFQVGKFRGMVEEIFKKQNISGVSDGDKKSPSNLNEIENSSAKLFEEIKIMFQDLPSRIERASPPEGRRKKRRFHPGTLDDMIEFSKNPKIGIKMVLSLYREKMPWIYEEGSALLNKLETVKTPSTRIRIRHEFEELLTLSTRNPFIEEYLTEDKDEYVLFMELPRVIMRALNRLIL
jgi:hypothetical protein